MKTFTVFFNNGSRIEFTAARYILKFEAQKPHHYEFTAADNSLVATVILETAAAIVDKSMLKEAPPEKMD